ncbi:MAG: hypothetical protein WD232_07605 [Acidimicrobiales bacterium]
MTSGEAVELVGPGGRPMRSFTVAISAEAMALAWARQEDAPPLAVVVVDHEVSPRGLHGRIWAVPATATLAFAVVLRPTVLAADEADAVWLAAGLAGAIGAEAASGRSMVTSWPDAVADGESGSAVAMAKAEVQLGPGQVTSAVATFRFDLDALGHDRRDRLFAAVLGALDDIAADLDRDPGDVAASYSSRCELVGKRVRAVLLPRGEARGTVRGANRHGQLELESSTGMVERVGVSQLRTLEER